eukprot:TRINITY_DN75467_c0_g1_i1.p1 TRINITY_DN75467_c0_g1~~TRINITY_DN75467_c0_g1_i1.p1  ORF type:complete len:674 (+),score=221.91 TRINITY_DN75467_c0_g1_i1:113-2134(+)
MSSQELNAAADDGNVDLIYSLMKRVPDGGVRPWLAEALLRAAYENRSHAVHALLKVQAEPSAVDDLGLTSLHWAARQMHEGIAQALLEAQADVLARNHEGAAPLHLAASADDGKITQLLLQSKADCTAMAKDKRTALHMAADRGAMLAAKALMEQVTWFEGKEVPNPQLSMITDRGESPVARAAARGHTEMVAFLLRRQADPSQCNWWGQSPLQLAAHAGHYNVCQALLDNAADVDNAAQDGSTALHSAVERSHPKVAQLLMTYSAKVEASGAGGRRPLHVAAERGAAECIDALIANGADVDSRTEELRTPLSFAAHRGHTEVARALLDRKADCLAFDAVRQTALHMAALGGRTEVGQLLIERRVRVDSSDAAGRTAIALSLGARQYGSVRLLLKNGAEMPEQYAKVPELQPLIAEVEAEILQEQLRALEAGKSDKAVNAAEREFEEARVRLLQAAQASAAATQAPAISHFTELLHDATEDLRLARAAEKNNKEQLAFTITLCKTKAVEVDKNKLTLKECKVTLANLKLDFKEKAAEVERLKTEIIEAREAARIAAELEKKNRNVGLDILEKARLSAAELAALVEEGNARLLVLAKLQEQLAGWYKQKEQVAVLHARAYEMLNRPASPGPEEFEVESPKAKKEKLEAERAAAAKAEAEEKERKKKEAFASLVK